MRAVDRAALVALALLVMAAWAALLAQAWRAGGEEPFFAALCGPALAVAGGGWRAAVFDWATTSVLWSVMSIAMMLPTAVPMVLSYSVAASRQGAAAPSPLVVAVGYGAVWLAVSAAAALVQVLGARLVAGLFAGLFADFAPPPQLTGVLAGAAIGAAGLYQFSEWKLACLAVCRHDVPAEAAARGAAGVFAEGVSQGLRCLGCCGAVMALMLLAGVMNLFWMAGFALMMTLEKLSTGLWAPRAIGVLLVTLGLAVAVGGVGLAPILGWLRG